MVTSRLFAPGWTGLELGASVTILRMMDRILDARPWPFSTIHLPASLWITGDYLHWFYGKASVPSSVPLRPNVESFEFGPLSDFVQLVDAPAARILKFASKWGPLYICKEHFVPSSHYVHVPSIGDTATLAPDHDGVRKLSVHDRDLIGRGLLNGCELDWYRKTPKGKADISYREPLERWRYYARLARGLVGIATDVHRGGVGLGEDWAILHPHCTAPRSNSDARMALMPVLDTWLRHAGAVPQLRWHETGADVSLGWGTLFGALALNLFGLSMFRLTLHRPYNLRLI